jgi:2-polyprenyl-3-methyl-5-hydroxy-6-metoxy-1,4-benzoquinol methylase
MSIPPSPLKSLRARLKAAWMAGDFGQIARYNEPAAEQFIARRAIKPGVRVLDVACGAGTLATPTTKTGAKVTSICPLAY